MILVLDLSFFSPFSGLRHVLDDLCKTAKLLHFSVRISQQAGSRADSIGQ